MFFPGHPGGIESVFSQKTNTFQTVERRGYDAAFRIEKTRNYTVMSNHHLRNAGLSLKSKGLLSMTLSLPEYWNCEIKKPQEVIL